MYVRVYIRFHLVGCLTTGPKPAKNILTHPYGTLARAVKLIAFIFYYLFIYLIIYLFFRGTLLVAQLVEAPGYKPEGRGFDSRWCHWIFSLA